jgi:hypothetical protein
MSWLKSLNIGKKVGIYCADVSDAFDWLSSQRLLAKLGLQRGVLGTLRSWLRSRTSHVVVAGAFSRGATFADMVFQGRAWGRSLWNSFVGDLAFVVRARGFCIVIYADDINISKAYPRRINNDVVFHDLHSIQTDVHSCAG